jgi:putative metallohydrolase (TIGR04338 family)
MRDTQKQKVYEAEFALRDLYDRAMSLDSPVVELDGIRLTLPPEARFASIESIQSYANKVLPFGNRVTVRARQGTRAAHYEPITRTVAIPDDLGSWALREIVVLHELAHHLSRTDHEGGGGHGPHFVATFTQLLADTMGPEVGLAYRVLCAHSGAREIA